MKRVLSMLVFLLATVLTCHAQEISGRVHPDALAQFQENPVEYLKNWEKQQLISYELKETKQAVEATLNLIFFTPKGQWHTITSQPFKLFPGTILFPGNIFFPGNILDKMPKGNGLILFDLHVNDFETLGNLQELPSKSIIVFTN